MATAMSTAGGRHDIILIQKVHRFEMNMLDMRLVFADYRADI
jgi:hypothetical protein